MQFVDDSLPRGTVHSVPPETHPPGTRSRLPICRSSGAAALSQNGPETPHADGPPALGLVGLVPITSNHRRGLRTYENHFWSKSLLLVLQLSPIS